MSMFAAFLWMLLASVITATIYAYVIEVQFRMDVMGCSLRDALRLRTPKCWGRESTHRNDGASTKTTVTYYDQEECP